MLEKVLKKYSKNVYGIIQVGAHIGQQVEIFLKFKNINIYLFEPQKEPLKILKKYDSYPNIYIFNFGLGNKNSNEKLFISNKKNGASSSVLKPKLHKKYFPEVQFSDYETIEIKKFSNLKNISANFLMLDVQGYELEVLKGFDKRIEGIDFIYSEISIEEFYEGNTLISDLDNYLFSKGFIRKNTFLYSNIPMGDALYIRKIYLNKLSLIFYKIKARFQIGKLYRSINFFSNRKKFIFVMKNKIKKILKN